MPITVNIPLAAFLFVFGYAVILTWYFITQPKVKAWFKARKRSRDRRKAERIYVNRRKTRLDVKYVVILSRNEEYYYIGDLYDPDVKILYCNRSECKCQYCLKNY